VPSHKRLEHNTSAQTGGHGCFSCHDGKQHYGREVFSGDDAQSCEKCHNLKGDIKCSESAAEERLGNGEWGMGNGEWGMGNG